MPKGGDLQASVVLGHRDVVRDEVVDQLLDLLPAKLMSAQAFVPLAGRASGFLSGWKCPRTTGGLDGPVVGATYATNWLGRVGIVPAGKVGAAVRAWYEWPRPGL